jgi:hypothetical protein
MGQIVVLTVIKPHSIFASLLREQCQPAIFKRMKRCLRPSFANSQLANRRAKDVLFPIYLHVVGILRLNRKPAPESERLPSFVARSLKLSPEVRQPASILHFNVLMAR